MNFSAYKCWSYSADSFDILQAMFQMNFFSQVQKCQEKWYVTFHDTSIHLPSFCSLIALKNNANNEQKEGKLSTGNLLSSE